MIHLLSLSLVPRLCLPIGLNLTPKKVHTFLLFGMIFDSLHPGVAFMGLQLTGVYTLRNSRKKRFVNVILPAVDTAFIAQRIRRHAVYYRGKGSNSLRLKIAARY